MKAGKLDRELTVLRRVQTGTSDLNEPIYAWQVLRTVWAALVFKTEDESFAAGQRYAKRAVTWRTRFMDDITAEHRLQAGGETYNVLGIREIGRRAGLEIAAEWQEPPG